METWFMNKELARADFVKSRQTEKRKTLVDVIDDYVLVLSTCMSNFTFDFHLPTNDLISSSRSEVDHCQASAASKNQVIEACH